MTVEIRRVRREEWALARALRLEALADPVASIAFLDTVENARVRPDEFWQDRTANAATTGHTAQFVAVDGDQWIGSLTVRRRAAGTTDEHGRAVTVPRGEVVGVYVTPSHRASGLIDRLFATAVEWAAAAGDAQLALEVHADNARAQAAYARAGFVETGHRFTGPVGPELEMARPLTDGDRVPA